MSERDTLDVVRQAAVWFEAAPDGFGALLDTIGDASLVLIGEASHGTHEFYRTRAELTKALILRKGFNVIAVEADWPDAYRANQWVRHASDDQDAETALSDFTRFPRWMWRNRDVVAFLEWLHGYNASRATASRVGLRCPTRLRRDGAEGADVSPGCSVRFSRVLRGPKPRRANSFSVASGSTHRAFSPSSISVIIWLQRSMEGA